MARLACPHCNQPVKVSPIGRWYSRFLCPHCRRALQFGAATNAIGIAGSSFFFVMMWALLMGESPGSRWVAAGAGALWVTLVALSHATRRIEKAP
jgi:hypothetical protein